jgi:methyl-accepting chemotaxis protein
VLVTLLKTSRRVPSAMFSRLSIRTKIISLVSLLLLALAGMGLLSAKNMRSLNANTHEIAGNWLESIKTLGALNAGVTGYRAVLRSHLLAETLEEKELISPRTTPEFASLTKR